MLAYIRKFSATEKAVFAVLVLAALVTAIIMAVRVNSFFMVEIPISGGTLREGLVGLPHTVNPVLAVTDVDRDISSLVYAGLTRDADGTTTPDLATDWSVSSDGLTYTFDLRPGLTFQDGSPLTADDVAFTVAKIQDPALKSPRAADWANVSVTVVSPTRIMFALKQPYGSFLEAAAIGIIPKHIWSQMSDDQFIFNQDNIEAVGAGPYRFSGSSRDQAGIPTDYRLSAWNGYHSVSPNIASIVFSFYPDQDHALAALGSGAIDSLPSISPDAAAKLASDSAEPYTVVSAPLSRVFGVFFDQTQNPVLADPAVRQALSLSVDRQAIIRTALLGYGVPVTGPLPPGFATTTDGSSLPDLAAAQALLAKAGWKKGTSGVYGKKAGKTATTTLAFTLYTADVPDLRQAAESLKAEWAALGADVDVKVYDPSDLYQNVIRPRKYDALLFGEQIGSDGDAYAFWHSSERNAPGLNVAMYANSQADKLLEAIRATPNGPVRTAEDAQLEQQIGADAPAVFLYAPDFIYAVPKALHGVSLSEMSMSSDRFSSESSWYIETERIWKIFAK